MRRKLSLLIVLSLVLSLGLVSAQDDIPRGGTIVVSEGQQAPFQRNFNPFSPDPTRWTTYGIFEPLLVFNPVEGGVATPWLATAYEYSDDLMSIDYTIREGVLWSDGEPFSADDVVFTFDLMKEYPALDRGGVYQFLDNVEKVGDNVVRFNLNKVYTQAHAIIGAAQIVPQHQWSQIDDPITFTNPEPVGTGPLTEIGNFSEQLLELCRNPNYWQTIYIDCMQQPLFLGNDPANLAAVSGELDWIGNFIPDIEATFVAADPDNHFYYFWPGGGTVQLYVNTTKAPFDDPEFRRALSMAIDYDAVTGIGMYGYTIPANPTGLGPRHETWISEEALALAEAKGLGQYNPDGAAAVLDEAGYVDANGDGFRDLKDGTPFSFKVQVVNGWTDWVTSVQIMSQNFQDIGLNAAIETPDFGVWLNNLQTGTYDTSIGWSTSGNTPWDFYRNVLDSALIGDDGLANAQLWGRWVSDEADALINAFTATADLAEQQQIVNELQMLYVDNVVAIPLFPGPTWYEYTTHRFTGFPTREDYYAQGSPWDGNSRLIVLTRIHLKQ
jgi:peptide/nickel transport system substrate-binding protein